MVAANWQTVAVAVLVLLAALYSLWYLMPPRWRGRLGKLNASLAKSPSCGACSQCGKCGVVSDAALGAPKAASQPIFFQRKP